MVLAAVLFSLGSAYAGAESVVLATGEWPPYTSEKLPEYGFVTKIVTAACNAGGITPEYHFYPWARAEMLADSCEVFAAFPYVITEEKKKNSSSPNLSFTVKIIFCIMIKITRHRNL